MQRDRKEGIQEGNKGQCGLNAAPLNSSLCRDLTFIITWCRQDALVASGERGPSSCYVSVRLPKTKAVFVRVLLLRVGVAAWLGLVQPALSVERCSGEVAGDGGGSGGGCCDSGDKGVAVYGDEWWWSVVSGGTCGDSSGGGAGDGGRRVGDGVGGGGGGGD